ncbi:MAG: hypothetical protein PHU33_06360 [Bacteroidales bacterium]|nr:hypothetical protein [Bacteroidales bacterium]
MKRTILLLILLCGKFALLFSQIDEAKNYVVFYTDSVLYARNIEFETPAFAENYLAVDSLKINPDHVKYFKCETGFYANIKSLNPNGQSSFVQRIRRGKINLYKDDFWVSSPMFVGANGMYSPGVPTRMTIQYYEKENETIKKAKYKNLKLDLADNPRSMDALNQFKKIRNTQVVLYLIGGALLVSGTIGLINHAENSNNNSSDNNRSARVLPTAAVISGVTCFFINYIIDLQKPRKIKKAIEIYNE